MLISGVKICAIVPITKMAGRLDPLKRWVTDAAENGMGVLLVHDIRDETTSRELHALMTEFESFKVRLVEKEFGDQGTARNYGILNSSSEWIVFWDSDDVPEPQSVIQAVNNADTQTDLIVGQYRIRDQKMNVFDGKLANRWSDLPRSLGLWRMAFRRESLSSAEFPALQMAEDQVFFIRMMMNIRRTEFSPEYFYTYAIGELSQITRNRVALKIIPLAISVMCEEFKKIVGVSQKKFVLNLILRLAFTHIKRNLLGKHHVGQ